MRFRPVYLLAPRVAPPATPSEPLVPRPTRRRFLGGLGALGAGIAAGWTGHVLLASQPSSARTAPRADTGALDFADADVAELLGQAEYLLVYFEIRPSLRDTLRPAVQRLADAVVDGGGPLQSDPERRRTLALDLRRVGASVDPSLLSRHQADALEALR